MQTLTLHPPIVSVLLTHLSPVDWMSLGRVCRAWRAYQRTHPHSLYALVEQRVRAALLAMRDISDAHKLFILNSFEQGLIWFTGGFLLSILQDNHAKWTEAHDNVEVIYRARYVVRDMMVGYNQPVNYICYADAMETVRSFDWSLCRCALSSQRLIIMDMEALVTRTITLAKLPSDGADDDTPRLCATQLLMRIAKYASRGYRFALPNDALQSAWWRTNLELQGVQFHTLESEAKRVRK